MNINLFIDAVGCLDAKLIEKYISMRKQLKTDKIIKKRIVILKKTVIASCFTLMLLSTFFLTGVFNYINWNGHISALIARYFAVALLISFVVVAIIGFFAWNVGKKYIKKKCNNYNVL